MIFLCSNTNVCVSKSHAGPMLYEYEYMSIMTLKKSLSLPDCHRVHELVPWMLVILYSVL